jgi:benzoyl-CoA reductase/2-hydroxyglutaryl-CoA dehydratase subunit BcrC/BadD/HgdB
MSRIGITTTIPIEAVFAAGHVPVDLNNLFITHREPEAVIERAEVRGFPRTLCSWVKGIYGILQEVPDIATVIAVIEGDCSNTVPLMEILKAEGREVLTFSYPYNRDRGSMAREIDRLMSSLGADRDEVMAMKSRLDQKRLSVHALDDLTWREGKVTGFENHLFLINTSDFKGDPEAYGDSVRQFTGEARIRAADDSRRTRLGYVGVPPIFSDLYEFLEHHDARIIFNEVQRQFSMPQPTEDLIEQYLAYSYPYGIDMRIADIAREVEKRGIQGLIHYTQLFCHHQMEHLLLKEHIPVPLLLLEGDRPGMLDGRTKLRVESFLEMVR